MLHVSIDQDCVRTARRPRARSVRWLERYWPEALGVVTALSIATIFIGIDPCPDVAWQLWIGHQLRHGARFYVDIIETNPPLWFWMAVPIDWAAELAGTGPAKAMVATMAVLSALSTVVTGRLLGAISAPSRAVLLVYVALTLMLMPLLDLGQREHILLIATLPYVALAARRQEGKAVSPWLAVAIGIGSAIGFGLKHYFLVAPALIELWLIATLGRRYRPIRPETAAIAIIGAMYAIAVVTLTPAYLRDIVPMLRLTYGALRVRHFGEMIGVIQYYWVLLIAVLLCRVDLLVRTPIAMAFAIAAVGFAAAWLIQFKGWPNHCVPVTGCLMLTVASIAATHCRTSRSRLWVIDPILLLAPMVVAVLFTPYRDPMEAATKPMRSGLGTKDSVAFVSQTSTMAWPLTLNRGFRYPSRHYGMWMFGPLIEGDAVNPAIMDVEHRVVDETAQDYSCAQPMRIIFDRRLRRGKFDMEAFFLSHPRFAQLMRHYRHIGRYHQFDLFQKIAPFPAPPAGSCRRGV